MQDEEQEEGPSRGVDSDRESIWTIPTRLKRWYFALFSTQIVLAAVWLVSAAIQDESTHGATGVILYIWQHMAPAAVASAAFALVIVDGANLVMVLSTWLAETLDKRRRKEQERHRQQIEAAKEFARMEATAELKKRTAEVQRRWEEWNRRREAAAAAGEDFSEPPPGSSEDPADAK